MESTQGTRDIRFDMLRGIATLVVVFGHVLQYSIKDYEDSLIFNIVWSLQIPLFMVVSGYFSTSRKEPSLQKLGSQLFRYLWPCVTYFIILSVVYHHQNPLSSAYNLLWHLEGTLWYLVVLAVLSIFNFVATKTTNKITNLIGGVLYSAIFFGMVAIFALPGLKLGFTFLGIKYVLYYSLFYWVGHMWHYAGKVKFDGLAKVTDISFAVMAAVYFYIICTVNLYMTEDTLLGILPRVVGSICGIYLVCYSVKKIDVAGKISHVIACVGQNSLEIYFIHCVLIRSFISQQIEVISTSGIVTISVGFIFVLAATFGILAIIKKSKYLYGFVFGAKLKVDV